MKKVIRLFLLVSLLFLCLFGLFGCKNNDTSNTEDGNPDITEIKDGYLYFYVDSDDVYPYAEVKNDGSFITPDVPNKVDCKFGGWYFSGDMSPLEANKEYNYKPSTYKAYAVWDDSAMHKVETKTSVFDDGDWWWVCLLLAFLLSLIAFTYYWFGIKNRGLKELGKAIKVLFTKKTK